jgi:hypothetical protein
MRTISALKISVAIEKLAVVLASNRLIKADRALRYYLIRSCDLIPRS